MLSWWTNLESIAEINNWILTATLVCAALTGLVVYLTAGKSRRHLKLLSSELKEARKQVKALEKAAEGIRKELLQTQQHHDINQLKLKTSTSSAKGLRQELDNARQRLARAEAAVETRQSQEVTPPADNDEHFETLDLELEPQSGMEQSQREQLIDLLDPGPKGNVDLYCVMGNEESEKAALELDDVLTADGWKTNGVAPSAFSTPPKGLVLVVNSKETAPSYASFLQRVFTTIGMEVTAKMDSKYREWSLSVIVGEMDS